MKLLHSIEFADCSFHKIFLTIQLANVLDRQLHVEGDPTVLSIFSKRYFKILTNNRRSLTLPGGVEIHTSHVSDSTTSLKVNKVNPPPPVMEAFSTCKSSFIFHPSTRILIILYG